MAPPARILVTGANGFVGSHLLPVLAGAFPGAVLDGAAVAVAGPRIRSTRCASAA